MSKEIRVECFKVDQSGREIYVFVMNSKVLRSIASVSRRGESNKRGYQRFLSGRRLNEIGDYIKKPGATFPNSIIVNLDSSKSRFEPAAQDNRGTLVIAQEDGAAWVIDGQHRLYGFECSDGKEFDLVVSAFRGLNVPDQAKIFKVINSKQKGVSLSLIYDLIDLTKDAEYEDQRAHEIVKALNEDEDSPWLGQVKMLGVGAGIISQSAFVTSVKFILQDHIFKDFEATDQTKVLKDFYSALRGLFPHAWGSRMHVLCKTLGVSATMMILPKVLIHCRLKNDFSQAMMKRILHGLSKAEVPTSHGDEQLDFSGDQLGVYGGKKGWKALAKILEDALPSTRP